jgi:cytochrome c
MYRCSRLLVMLLVTAPLAGLRPVHTQLIGHGGPVRAIAVSVNGKTVLSGSFDTAAIRWSLATESAEQVLRLHADAVNAVVCLSEIRLAHTDDEVRREMA